MAVMNAATKKEPSVDNDKITLAMKKAIEPINNGNYLPPFKPVPCTMCLGFCAKDAFILQGLKELHYLLWHEDAEGKALLETKKKMKSESK